MQELPPVPPSAKLQISRHCSPKNGAASGAEELCCREVEPRLEPLPDMSATTKHVRSALRTRDVDRSSRSLAASRTSHLSARTGGEKMTNELDRLLTITDLSEMLGVPVDTLYGWRHRGEGPAGYRIGRDVRYRRAAVEAWLDTQADRRHT